jgi:HEAT repeat protein
MLNIRANEGRAAALLIGVMSFSAAGYSLGGTGIEALYFARFGTDLLPHLYMGLGILSLVTTLAITGLLGRVKRERMYVWIPLAAAILLVIAWISLFSTSRAVFPVLWLGKESLNTITSMIAWNTAGAVCDSRQAKRLFPLFNGARILGSVLGGLGTGPLVELIGTQNLVLIWAVSMALVFGLTQLLMGGRVTLAAPGPRSRVKRRAPSFIHEMQKGWEYVRRSELLRWMSVAAILFSVLYFSIALPFSKSATLQYPNEKELAGFLGLFNGLSTAAAFITSMFFANRMYARFGIMSMILALPLIYLAGFSSLIFFDVFTVIVAFRFVQMLWLSGVADAAYQTMFSAIPPEKRDQVNAFLNGVPEQAGVFLAGGILIVGEQAFTSQQLYLVGLSAAAATCFIIWRASSAYRDALVASLREGRPTIFSGRATLHDTTTLNVALENVKHRDALVRRVSAEMLGDLKAYDALIPVLQDEDADVRLAALSGLTGHAPAVPHVTALLADPLPAVRARAIHTLRHSSTADLQALLTPLLSDEDAQVQIETAIGLLNSVLRAEAQAVILTHLRNGSASIRLAAASALGKCGQEITPALAAMLADEDPSVREAAGIALAGLGGQARALIIDSLRHMPRAEGALLALSYTSSNQDAIKSFLRSKLESALYYHQAALGFKAENERLVLLIDSLHARARGDGALALRAFGILHDRESVQTALENLQSRESTQRANALETLEAARNARLIKPLLVVWDSHEHTSRPQTDMRQLKNELLHEPDDWLRACAKFALQGDTMDIRTTLPAMERILFLRRVPLLADLSPSDLQRIAALISEHHADAGEVIFEQGETGEEMYVIVHGTVRVMISNDGSPEKEVARRGPGDVVGEMSIISGEPRIASLVAAEETHLLCLDKKSFEGVLRERPEVGLAVMRVLCARLKEATK